MDFAHDQYGDGRRLNLLPVEDLFTLECLWVEVDRSMSSVHATRVLDRSIEQRGKPGCIQTDNGPEFTSRALCQWARQNGIEIRYIEPGKPIQNAYIESLNGTLRYECLDAHWFSSLEDAREQVASWRYTYNWVRSHSSLGRMPPGKFAEKAAGGTAPTSMGGHSRGAGYDIYDRYYALQENDLSADPSASWEPVPGYDNILASNGASTQLLPLGVPASATTFYRTVGRLELK